MPPKKGASSTGGSGRTTFLSTVPSVDQLTPAHALQLAGLSQAAGFSLKSDRSAPSPVASGSGSSKLKRSNGKGREDPIELCDSTDDEGVKGKGKSRESSDGGDAGRPPLPHVCKKATCTNNPNCLAFLGQDKWEDKGSSKAKELCRPLQNASHANTDYARASPTPPTLPRLSPSIAIRESSTSVHEDPRARSEPPATDARDWYTVRTPSASLRFLPTPLAHLLTLILRISSFSQNVFRPRSGSPLRSLKSNHVPLPYVLTAGRDVLRKRAPPDVVPRHRLPQHHLRPDDAGRRGPRGLSSTSYSLRSTVHRLAAPCALSVHTSERQSTSFRRSSMGWRHRGRAISTRKCSSRRSISSRISSRMRKSPFFLPCFPPRSTRDVVSLISPEQPFLRRRFSKLFLELISQAVQNHPDGSNRKVVEEQVRLSPFLRSGVHFLA